MTEWTCVSVLYHCHGVVAASTLESAADPAVPRIVSARANPAARARERRVRSVTSTRARVREGAPDDGLEAPVVARGMERHLEDAERLVVHDLDVRLAPDVAVVDAPAA